jgi:hypothetical protein
MCHPWNQCTHAWEMGLSFDNFLTSSYQATLRDQFYNWVYSLELLQAIKTPHNVVGKITYKQNIAMVSRFFQSLQIFPRPKDQGEENLQIWLKYRPHGRSDKARDTVIKVTSSVDSFDHFYRMLVPNAPATTAAPRLRSLFLTAY